MLIMILQEEQTVAILDLMECGPTDQTSWCIFVTILFFELVLKFKKNVWF